MLNMRYTIEPKTNYDPFNNVDDARAIANIMTKESGTTHKIITLKHPKVMGLWEAYKRKYLSWDAIAFEWHNSQKFLSVDDRFEAFSDLNTTFAIKNKKRGVK